LKEQFAYPVSVSRKENGFLGLIGYNADTDELVFTTKGSIDGDHVHWFKEIVNLKLADKLDETKQAISEKNLTLVFEVIDPENDPHIIEAQEKEIILLDAVKRDLEFEKMDYDYLRSLAGQLGVAVREIELMLHDAADFEKFYVENLARDPSAESIEGYVLEDAAGLMVKLKLPYYLFWKSIRDYLERYQTNKSTRVKRELLADPVFRKFMNWLELQDESYKQKSIIELRKLFIAQS